MIWQKVTTDPTKKYYFTIQNISVVPNSYVYIKIKDTDSTPTDDNGAIKLTSKNMFSSVLPANSYMYLATSDGGVIGSVVNEVIPTMNYDIETVHHDIALTSGLKDIDVPKGGLLVLQNKTDETIYFTVGKKEGKGELEKHQIFAIAFAKDTKVQVTGNPTAKFTYIITNSINMTGLDKTITDKLDYILSNLNIFTDKYITKEALEQVANMIGRGEWSSNLNFNIGNSNEIEPNECVSINIKGNPQKTNFQDAIIEAIGELTFYEVGQTQELLKTSFSLSIDSNNITDKINDIFLGNEDAYGIIDSVKLFMAKNKESFVIKFKLNKAYKVTGSYKVRVAGYRYEVKTKVTSFDNTNSDINDYIVKSDKIEYMSKESIAEIHNKVVEDLKNAKEKVIEDFIYNSASSTDRKLVFNKMIAGVSKHALSVDFDETTGILTTEISKTTLGSDLSPSIISRITGRGFKRGHSFSIPLFFFSDEEASLTKTIAGDIITFKIKLHAFKSVNKEYYYYKEYFKNLYKRLEEHKDEDNIVENSKLIINYLD